MWSIISLNFQIIMRFQILLTHKLNFGIPPSFSCHKENVYFRMLTLNCIALLIKLFQAILVNLSGIWPDMMQIYDSAWCFTSVLHFISQSYRLVCVMTTFRDDENLVMVLVVIKSLIYLNF